MTFESITPAKHIEAAERKMALTRRLTDALCDWLNFDQVHLIEAVKQCTKTPLDLLDASEVMNGLQEQYDQFEQAIAQMPEEMRTVMTSMKIMLEQQIRNAQENVKNIQAELEAQL